MGCIFVCVHTFESMLVCTPRGYLFPSKKKKFHWNSTATSSCQPHVSYSFSLCVLVPRRELTSQWPIHGRLNRTAGSLE